MRKNRKRYHVTVYAITRRYGGPEEGGWWYNWCEVDHTHCYGHHAKSRAKALRAFDRERRLAHDYSYGDIYSSLGGVEYVARLEVGNQYRSWEDKVRPHYE